MHKDKATSKFFSKAAAAYEREAHVHREIAEKLTAYLPVVPPESVFEFGCGTGFLTRLLAARWPGVPLYAIDISPGMVQQAQEVVGREYSSIAWEVADAQHFHCRRCFDLIVSSSALQWLQPLPRFFAHLSSLLVPGGKLIISAMTSGTLGELREIRRNYFSEKPLSSDLPAAAHIRAALDEAGFSVEAFEEEECKEYYASAQELLAVIKRLGFTGGPLSAAPNALSRAELRQLVALYDERFGREGEVPATFNVCYFRAGRG